MKRFLVPFAIVMLMAMFLPGCGANAGPVRWGDLTVSLENPTAADQNWSALLTLQNTAREGRAVQFGEGPYYSVIVTQGQREVYRGSFTPQNEPRLLNIMPTASVSYPVTWSYVDQAGQRVAPGTYRLSVELHGLTERVRGGKVVGPYDVVVR